MATAPKVKWSMEADYFQACSCNYGCPCEFEASPTQGFCKAVAAWRINRGRYGDISLDGLALGYAAHFPSDLYKGNGTCVLFFDERANPQQRDALMKIATGQMGGMPFEIIVKLLTKVLDPQYVRFQFSGTGRNSGVQIGNAASMAFEPIKNPVTGEPESARVEHATGFIFKGAEAVSAKECRSNVPGLAFSHPDKCGFVTQVKYGN